MKTIERISLIGLGSVGAAYAATLQLHKASSLTVIANPQRIDAYQAEGVHVNGRPFRFQYVSPDTDVPPADLVLISVKASGLTQALSDIRKHVGPNTRLLSLLNGIHSEDAIHAVYPRPHPLFAVCIGIDAVREGRNIQYSDLGRICFGEARNDTLSEDVVAIKNLFDAAHIPYEIPTDMQNTIWWKFMINVGINQTSAVLRAPYSVFQQNREARNIMRSAMREVIEIAQASGIHLHPSDMDRFESVLETLAPTGKTSMLQDIEAHRQTEVNELGGQVCALGRNLHIATPVNDLLVQMIRVLERS